MCVAVGSAGCKRCISGNKSVLVAVSSDWSTAHHVNWPTFSQHLFWLVQLPQRNYFLCLRCHYFLAVLQEVGWCYTVKGWTECLILPDQWLCQLQTEHISILLSGLSLTVWIKWPVIRPQCVMNSQRVCLFICVYRLLFMVNLLFL